MSSSCACNTHIAQVGPALLCCSFMWFAALQLFTGQLGACAQQTPSWMPFTEFELMPAWMAPTMQPIAPKCHAGQIESDSHASNGTALLTCVKVQGAHNDTWE